MALNQVGEILGSAEVGGDSACVDAELGAQLRTAQAQRSTHRRTGPLRVVIDPVRIG